MSTINAILAIITIILGSIAACLMGLVFALNRARDLYRESTKQYVKARYNYALAYGKHAEEYLDAGDYHRELGQELSARADKWARLGLHRRKL